MMFNGVPRIENNGGHIKVVTVNFQFGKLSSMANQNVPRHTGFGFGGGAGRGGPHQNFNFMARYTKQELIPIDVNMYIKDFHKFLKEYAKKLLQAAVVDKIFGKTVVMLPGESTLLTSANLEIKIDDKESVWNQVRVNQILSSNYNFRTEISSYTAKSAMFDIMAAVEEHRGSSSVVDEKKVDVKSQEEDEVVVMQGYCPCPRLNKLLSNLGMAHHQDAIVKQELTLDLLLSLEPSKM